MKKFDKVMVEPFFLGPKSENEYWVREKIQSTLDHWFQWRKSLFESDSVAIERELKASPEYKIRQQKLSENLDRLHGLLKAETAKYTPRYIGHMVSEISLPAILGHFSALLHNPNNTSIESARVGSLLEKEGIEMLLDVIGYDSKLGHGHFTSGGTVANFEALWRARFRLDHWLSVALYLKIHNDHDFDVFSSALMGWERFNSLVQENDLDLAEELREYSMVAGNPWKVSALLSQHGGKTFTGPVILVPGNKHFSWQKGCNLLGFGEEALWSIPLDGQGKIDCAALEALIEKAHLEDRPVLMVVSVAGTTETAEIDPIDKVQEILDRLKQEKGWDIWHHVDAAYGGFMCTFCHNPELGAEVVGEDQLKALAAISRSNSVTMDPHKLGYIPYSCGAFLVPDEQNYAVSNFSAPYLDREHLEQGKWSSTLEGSRTASGASATWLTGKSLDFTSRDFAGLLANTFRACQEFEEEMVRELSWFRPLHPSETNVLCFSVAENGEPLSESNRKTEAVFKKILASPNFSVSKTVLHSKQYGPLIESHVESFSGQLDCESAVLIRCVFMNPFWSNVRISKSLREEFRQELDGFYREL